MGAGSPDYVARTIFNAIEVIKPSIVAILWPPKSRAEIIKGTDISVMGAWMQNYPRVLSDDNYQQYLLIKNIEIVNLLCAAHGSILVSNLVEDIYNNNYVKDHARDSQHFGPLTHTIISNMMFDQYTQKIKL
jgi:hypothetical protein